MFHMVVPICIVIKYHIVVHINSQLRMFKLWYFGIVAADLTYQLSVTNVQIMVLLYSSSGSNMTTVSSYECPNNGILV